MRGVFMRKNKTANKKKVVIIFFLCAGLLAALAGRRGVQSACWYGPVTSEAEVNGCARPLGEEGEALLKKLHGCGYLNVLFN